MTTDEGPHMQLPLQLHMQQPNNEISSSNRNRSGRRRRQSNNQSSNIQSNNIFSNSHSAHQTHKQQQRQASQRTINTEASPTGIMDFPIDDNRSNLLSALKAAQHPSTRQSTMRRSRSDASGDFSFEARQSTASKPNSGWIVDPSTSVKSRANTGANAEAGTIPHRRQRATRRLSMDLERAPASSRQLGRPGSQQGNLADRRMNRSFSSFGGAFSDNDDDDDANLNNSGDTHNDTFDVDVWIGFRNDSFASRQQKLEHGLAIRGKASQPLQSMSDTTPMMKSAAAAAIASSLAPPKSHSLDASWQAYSPMRQQRKKMLDSVNHARPNGHSHSELGSSCSSLNVSDLTPSTWNVSEVSKSTITQSEELALFGQSSTSTWFSTPSNASGSSIVMNDSGISLNSPTASKQPKAGHADDRDGIDEFPKCTFQGDDDFYEFVRHRSNTKKQQVPRRERPGITLSDAKERRLARRSRNSTAGKSPRRGATRNDSSSRQRRARRLSNSDSNVCVTEPAAALDKEATPRSHRKSRTLPPKPAGGSARQRSSVSTDGPSLTDLSSPRQRSRGSSQSRKKVASESADLAARSATRNRASSRSRRHAQRVTNSGSKDKARDDKYVDDDDEDLPFEVKKISEAVFDFQRVPARASGTESDTAEDEDGAGNDTIQINASRPHSARSLRGASLETRQSAKHSGSSSGSGQPSRKGRHGVMRSRSSKGSMRRTTSATNDLATMRQHAQPKPTRRSSAGYGLTRTPSQRRMGSSRASTSIAEATATTDQEEENNEISSSRRSRQKQDDGRPGSRSRSKARRKSHKA